MAAAIASACSNTLAAETGHRRVAMTEDGRHHHAGRQKASRCPEKLIAYWRWPRGHRNHLGRRKAAPANVTEATMSMTPFCLKSRREIEANIKPLSASSSNCVCWRQRRCQLNLAIAHETTPRLHHRQPPIRDSSPVAVAPANGHLRGDFSIGRSALARHFMRRI